MIERMYFVSPSKGEQFFLRLLLTIFESGKSWEHLRTWNSQVFATFKETCIARGLLEDDHEWRICLEEAISMQPGMAYHQLLTVVRATRAEHSRRFLSLNYAIEWVTTHLQEIPQRIR